MIRRLTSNRSLVLGLLAIVASGWPQVAAATTRVVTWGDSITFGSYDGTSSGSDCAAPYYGTPKDAPEVCGISGRLGSRLDDPSRFSPIYDVEMLNLGKEGEKTPEALSRAKITVGVAPTCPCTGLATPCEINSLWYWYCNGEIQAEDLFVLMEGTNDVTQQIGVETTRTNLENLAAKAEWIGMNVMISTVTPRHPDGWTTAGANCSDNGESDILALNALVSTAASTHGWPRVDAHFVLDDTTGTFTNYYQDWDTMKCEGGVYQGSGDPVGHPNREGYDEIAFAEDEPGNYSRSFESIVRGALPPRLTLTTPTPPLTDGIALQFSATLHDIATFAQTVELTWNFGDGTIVTQSVSTSPAAQNHTYWSAGSFTVTVTAEHANGGARARSALLSVAPDTPLFADGFESGGTSNWIVGTN